MNSIQDKIKKLPISPGCYLFKNEKAEVIYVGKAKNLKNRVRSYFQKNGQLTVAKTQMVEKIQDLDYVIVDSEKEALLLEANLIKKYRPKYNVIFKDDKSFLYIKIDYSKVWPEIYWIRKPNLGDKQARFFGPYISAMAARSTLETIKKIFPLCGKLPGRNTPKSAFKQIWHVQTGEHENAPCPPDVQTRCLPTRPCFRYQIGRCMGPCAGQVTPEEYKNIFPKIIQFLKGNWTNVIRDLKKEMATASQKQQYEKAAKLRDQIEALTKTLEKQKIISNKKVDQDYVSLYVGNKNMACINLFKIRDGKLIDKQNFVLKNVEGKADREILEEFMDQYYVMNMNMPKKIVLPETIDNVVAGLAPAQDGIKYIIPQRGKKLQLLKMGAKNAQEYLEKQMASWQKREQSAQEVLNNLKNILNLEKLPQRIECYDISNIQGAHAVGSMVVFTNGEPDKGRYRKFKIKINNGPNDVGMMREVLTRRTRNQESKIKGDTWPMPDLIVVDGGKPQLNAIVSLFDELDIKNTPVCSLAKREEEIFVPDRKEPIILDRNSGELKLLQNLRDEAHRFGIGYYRKKHRRVAVKSVLDSIPGVGPTMRKKLIQNFGSVEGIRVTSDEELRGVVGKKLVGVIRENI